MKEERNVFALDHRVPTTNEFAVSWKCVTACSAVQGIASNLFKDITNLLKADSVHTNVLLSTNRPLGVRKLSRELNMAVMVRLFLLLLLQNITHTISVRRS